MKTVTKSDLTRMLVEDLGCKNSHAKQFVDAFFESLAEAITQGARIEARGFGAFDVRKTNARPRARNPRTGEKVFVPARRKVVFKPGKFLRKALSQPLESA